MAPALGDQTAGVFLHQGVEYVFSRTPQDCCQLLLVHPSSQSALTDRQLDGFVRQMRTFMQEMLLPVQLLSDDLSRAGGDPSGQDAAFQKTFCRMHRLLSNLDYLRSLGSSQAFFQPITMDLVGLCGRLSDEAASLLEGAGVTLTFRCNSSSLLIPGDPDLLSKLILTLLSNAAKAAPQGSVFLTLAQRRDRAILSVTDSGQDFAQEDLDTLFPSPLPDDRIPDPQEGAGMGLAIAGTSWPSTRAPCCWSAGRAAHCCRWSLCPPDRWTLGCRSSPPASRTPAGLSPVLVELSDVLPQSMVPHGRLRLKKRALSQWKGAVF